MKVITKERLAYVDHNGEVDYLDVGAECEVFCEDDEPGTYILYHFPYGKEGPIVELTAVVSRQWEVI